MGQSVASPVGAEEVSAAAADDDDDEEDCCASVMLSVTFCIEPVFHAFSVRRIRCPSCFIPPEDSFCIF